MTKTRLNNDLIDHIGAFYTKNDNELLWSTRPGAICDENQEDNSMTDHIGAVYVKNDTELSWTIRSSVDYGETKIWKLHDWSYNVGLCEKQNWSIMTDRIRYDLWRKLDKTMTWPII